MEVHEFILKRFRNNNIKNIYLFGEGGIGKTYALRRLYSRLLNDEYYVGAKRVLPIYISLAEVSIRGNKNETCIRQYIWNNYSCGQPTGRNTVTNLDSQILNASNSRYHFIILCDGINENANAIALRTEISILASYENVTICLTGRNKIEWLNDFEYVEVAPLDLKRVRNIVRSHLPENTLPEKTLELLRNPFNLTQWLGLSEADKANDYTKSKLLKRHIDRLVDVQNQHNSAKKYLLGNLTIYHETALKYVLRFLGALSWEMENENNMVISVNCPAWKRAKALYLDELKNELRLIKDIFENFLIPLGLFRRIDDKNFTYTHQNYRDYFAAQFLYDDNFGDFEYKISTYTISDSVLEYFSGFFKDKDSLYEFAHEANERISQCDVLKANAVLNKNIVRLFKETSNSIVNETFSNRDLCLADFNDFFELLDCDFSNSKFGEDTLWISSDGWNSNSRGEMHCTNKYIVVTGLLGDDIFETATGRHLKTIHSDNYEMYDICPTECFENDISTYVAHKCSNGVVVIDIESENRLYIDTVANSSKLIFNTYDDCLYIGGSSIMGVYNLKQHTIELINGVISCGQTKLRDGKVVTFYYNESELKILSDTNETAFKLNRIQDFNFESDKIIDIYPINGRLIIVTDKFIWSENNNMKDIVVVNDSSVFCASEIVETVIDEKHKKILILVREEITETLFVYDMESLELHNSSLDLKLCNRHFYYQKRLFVSGNEIYLFDDEKMLVGKIKSNSFEVSRQTHLDIRIFDIWKTEGVFLIFNGYDIEDAYSSKIQKINSFAVPLFENKHHYQPKLLTVTSYKENFLVEISAHNGKSILAIFDDKFKLMKTIKSLFSKIYISPDKSSCVYRASNTMGAQVYSLKSGTNSIESPAILSCNKNLESWISPTSLIPHLHDVSYMCFRGDNLLIIEKTNITNQFKYFVLQLSNDELRELDLSCFSSMIIFRNSNLILVINFDDVFLYNWQTQKHITLPFDKKSKQEIWNNLIWNNWFDSKIDEGIEFKGCLFWISKLQEGYFLNSISVITGQMKSTYICPTYRNIKMMCDNSTQSIFVVNTPRFSEDEKQYSIIDRFFDFDRESFQRTTSFSDKKVIGCYNNKLFAEGSHDCAGEHLGVSWAVLDFNTSNYIEVLYPFDKNVTGSNFNGCQFNEQQKQILTQYGAKPFTKNMEGN